MKIKTIKKILGKKIEEWAASVEDKKIKNLIRNHTIVTGGCIASMLLKEDVNDYDVYMDSKKAALAITKYYVGIANKELGGRIQVIDGKDYQGYDYWLEDYGEGSEKDTVAKDMTIKRKYKTWDKFKVTSHQMGRCVHKLDADRVKLFMPDKGMHRVNELNLFDDDNGIVGTRKPYYPCFFSSNAISLTNDLQVVIRFHGEASEIHKNYDFVHATNYYTHSDKTLYTNTNALEALMTKELRYIGSKYPLTSIIRTRKFIQRNYTIHAGSFLKMCYQVSQLDLNDLTVLEDQIAGVDIAYFETLLTKLRKERVKDPEFEIDYGYLSKIIDEIFD